MWPAIGESPVQEVRKINPKIPVILMSGYYPDRLAEFGRTVEADAILEKPFRNEQLLEVIEEILGKRAA